MSLFFAILGAALVVLLFAGAIGVIIGMFLPIEDDEGRRID